MARGSPPSGPDEVLRAVQRRAAEIADDELVPKAAFACVPDRLRGGGLDVSETFGDREQGPAGRGTGHRRTAGICLGGGRTAVHAQHGDARALF